MRVSNRKVLATLLVMIMGVTMEGCGALETRSLHPVIATVTAPIISTLTPWNDSKNVPLSTPVTTLSPSLVTSTPPTDACHKNPGRIETNTLSTKLMTQGFAYRIYLPPCYDAQPIRRFPLLILIHGLGYNDDQWQRLGAPAIVDRLVASGEMAPFIILMPNDASWREPGQDPFGQTLITELLPWVEQHYRVLPDRSQRAIGGVSRGAGWAVHLGLQYWQSFGAIGAHSLAIFHGDEPVIQNALQSLTPAQLPRIYVDVGAHDQNDIMKGAQWFETLLTAKEISHEWYLNQGYHDEKYWGAHVERYLRWYAQGWTP
jgi:enterochelin esterase-like enzyme